MSRMTELRVIETDAFPFEFLSRIGERESWRKEVHRPIYHVHKWWAKRLGTVFRGILLGCMLPEDADFPQRFYQRHAFSGTTVFDPFMGSGTTIGESHKLGLSALGRDINPVAVESVRVALGPLDRRRVKQAFTELSCGIGETIRALYRSIDAKGRPCDVLYYFWVMQATCPDCRQTVDLFPSYVIARNASPKKTEVQILCPSCGEIFSGIRGEKSAVCPSCGRAFSPEQGPATGRSAACNHCGAHFTILDAIEGRRPPFRLYGKLVLTKSGRKEYLPASPADVEAYGGCSQALKKQVAERVITIPALTLEDGYNTRQAMSYGFSSWRDFFNDRQLLALSLLRGDYWHHRCVNKRRAPDAVLGRSRVQQRVCQL